MVVPVNWGDGRSFKDLVSGNHWQRHELCPIESRQVLPIVGMLLVPICEGVDQRDKDAISKNNVLDRRGSTCPKSG